MSKIEVSNGNHKIGKDTLIFNITSATDCPSKPLGLCQIPDKCYAMKAEVQYPKTSLPYRRRQTEYWDKTSIMDIATDLALLVYDKKDIKYIRIGESGDFRSQEDVKKLQDVVNKFNFLCNKEIKFYVFTARSDLDFSSCPDNLTINGSGFMIDNNFKVVRKDESLIKEGLGDKTYLCGGDCRKCNLCKGKNGYKILVEEH